MPNAVLDVLGTGRAAVDEALESLCATRLDHAAAPVADAIRYGLLGEGKRLRGLLLIEAYRAAGGSGDASGLAASVEIVHAYSLVHDDLPCMDDDDVRRGRPTVHRVFGVAVATAAGVAMVPLAASTAYEVARTLGLSPGAAGDIVRELMRAAGGGGMIGGQFLDLESEGRSLRLEDLERIHRAKTGSLIAVSARIGAMAANADQGSVDAFSRFGEALGLAFQITDDVLDVTSTTHQLGKTVGRDAARRKSTYPQVLGVEGALDRARSLAGEARAVLQAASMLTPPLEALTHYAVERKT